MLTTRPQETRSSGLLAFHKSERVDLALRRSSGHSLEGLHAVIGLDSVCTRRREPRDFPERLERSSKPLRRRKLPGGFDCRPQVMAGGALPSGFGTNHGVDAGMGYAAGTQ